MEQLLLERLVLNLAAETPADRRLRSLTTARSLLLNPASSDSTRRAVSDALLRSLDHPPKDPTYLRHAIRLLGDAAALHCPLAASLGAAVRPLLSTGDHIAADALAVLASIDEIPLASLLDEDLILLIADSPVVSVRSRLVNLLVSARGFTLLHPNVTFRLLLGFAVDLYPLTRRAAMDGLVSLCRELESGVDCLAVECCYERATAALRDEEDFVRAAAVRLVSECGRIFAMAEEGTDRNERMDGIFASLCSMSRDMSMNVRIEGFIALGKVRVVSEIVLLQSLSKKVSGITSGKKVVDKCRESNLILLRAAGAFIHGIEDEFYEVRTAACKSLGMLTAFSVKFADDALDLLMDMLNDDAIAVRLQTLQTIYYMATSNYLTVQERHVHMFLGLLADTEALIRNVTRKTLQLMRLPELVIFTSTIDALITNMETYPEEEDGIFFVLFLIGKNHGSFAAKLANELSAKLAVSCDGELSLDTPRVAAFLILAISSPFSDEQLPCDIPSSLFSYALPLLGRISHSVRHILNQDILMSYLCYHSGISFLAANKKSKEVDSIQCAVEEYILNCRKRTGEIYRSSLQILNETSEVKEDIWNLSGCSQMKVRNLDENITHSIMIVLARVTRTWQLIKSCRTFETKWTLRACMEELETIDSKTNSTDSVGITFISEYIRVIQLIAELWEHVKPKKFPVSGMVAFDLLMEKLCASLKRIRYTFRGLHEGEECHILELTLLSYILGLCRGRTCSGVMLRKIRVVIFRLEHICGEGAYPLSDFSKELKKMFCEERTTKTSYSFPVRSLLELFCLEKIPFSGRFKHVTAELEAIGNDSENPLPFLPGLPVGITFRITLSHVTNNDRLWVRMTVGELIEHVFLDLHQFGGSGEVRECVLSLPFLATPRASSFTLRACVTLECPLEDVMRAKEDDGGPNYGVALLSKVKDVYLATVKSS